MVPARRQLAENPDALDGTPPAEETFDILISSAGSNKCRLEAKSSLVNAAYAEIKMPSITEWKRRLEQLQSALYFNTKQSLLLRDAAYGQELEDEQSNATPNLLPPKIISEVGKDLYDLLFARDIYNAFAISQQKARQSGASLNVRLTFDTPGLSFLPWETLHDGREHLALSPKSPVFRNACVDSDPDLPPVEFPIAVLGMVPKNNNSAGLGPVLNVEAEQANIIIALQQLLNQERAVLRWAAGSPSDLIDSLRQPPDRCASWHVFHFCGHGGFDHEEGKGYLVVDPDPDPIGLDGIAQNEAALYSDDLMHILEQASGLRLIILNSCRGGMGTEGAASVAEELVAGGFSAVIAMQFDISDRAAILFSATLYKYLSTGTMIHQAVTLARQRMKRAGIPEWITRVLYMRGRDGRLFRH